MTQLYVFVDDFFVDDFLKAHPVQSQWRRSPNDTPAFTDAEVITIGLMQGYFGCATLKKAYRQKSLSAHRRQLAHTLPASLYLPTLACPLARTHRHRWSTHSSCFGCAGTGRPPVPDGWQTYSRLYLMDGKPIPVCKPVRHGRVRLLREDGAYFGKNQAGWYFGFKLHALVHHRGAVICAILTPANWDEKQVALALSLAVDGGVVLADLGYRSRDDELDEALADEADLLLIHPTDAGPKQSKPRFLVSSLRERIETTFSGLWSRFVDRVYSRSWYGLWSSIKLKMLHYNLCHVGLITA